MRLPYISLPHYRAISIGHSSFSLSRFPQYIAASYVKFVESHGGRAVPVPYYADNATIDHLFSSLNGVLFPGGGAAVPMGAYRMYDNAVAANARGDHFPLWGTCMGFQWLLQLAGASLDGGFDSENVSLPLDMTAAAPDSKLFANLEPSLYAMLQDANHTSAFNNHGYGITPEHFASVGSLTDVFTVLSTSADRNGKAFVSTMEAPNLPFYGVQWHPEKNVWELGETATGAPYEAIPHGPDAVSVTLYLAAFLTAEARKSGHKFAEPLEEQAALIWNYPVFYTQPEFEQSYIYDF
jgi:gamma-glutamyl hydrolase